MSQEFILLLFALLCLAENNIKLSKIFKWFKKDFEQNGSLIDFFNQYSEVSISNGAKKSYKDYNWDLND